MRRISVLFLMCALGVSARTQTLTSDPAADLIVHNAVVHTMDPAGIRTPTAVAIREGRFTKIGDDRSVLALRGTGTRVVDAGGRAILPGLHDAHAHFLGLGASLQQIDLRGTKSLSEVVERVRAKAASAGAGEWILGRSWDQNDWPDARWPTSAALDAVAPNHPVYLTRVDGHAAVANGAALRQAGITAKTPDPPGGRLIRDASGEPTGVLIDRAMDLVRRLIPPPSPRQLEEQALLADAECRRLGLTTIHDAGVDADTVALYQRLVDEGRLKTRLYVMLRMPLDRLKPFFERGPILDPARHRLVVRSIKIGADGALGSRGAALLEPYSDEPATTGLLTTPEPEMYEMTREAAKAGFQTCIHAIGDRANRSAMDVFERVAKDVPGARALRQRNEHAQILDAAEIPRFAKLDVIASIQPTHCTSDMPWVPARIGPERTSEGAYVWRKLLDARAKIASGSDFPVEEPDPMLGLYAAVTRQTPESQPPNGWAPDQRLTREEAVRSFTLDAAYAAHAETLTGSIAPGKLADLVLLSHDVMKSSPADVLRTRILLTVIGGEVVHEATGR